VNVTVRLTTRVTTTRTAVGIVGAGPCGLLLAHLLRAADVDAVVLDHRTRNDIETTVRAGVLEHDSVRLLAESGASDRVLTDGDEHRGIELAFAGTRHRLDFTGLAGASVWLYPQTEVVRDLGRAHDAAGSDVRWGVAEVRVLDLDPPRLAYVGADGAPAELHCRFLVGADGSHSVCRRAVPPAACRQYFREYPFAWFGILATAPRSAPELVYNHSGRGFALISQRSESLQRLYFQCPPDTEPDAWSDDAVWAELQARCNPNGLTLHEGSITEKGVLPFRSFVHEPMQHGRLLLAGDAAHTVPPTGAKGLNLALHDARLLAELLPAAVAADDPAPLETYSSRAVHRVWRVQHFSYWMTTLLHQLPDATDFDCRRQLAELTAVVESRGASTFLAQAYTGWPVMMTG
jgi:p-hydroxybenzoate 3-monooxygenase